jgi:putative ABC transport system permease protein
VRLLLEGLWARRSVNAAVLLVTVTAVAATVLGPTYARASAEHLLDLRIAQRAPYDTGLTFSVPAMPQRAVPVGSPARYHPPAPKALLAQAVKPLSTPAGDRFWKPTRRWLLDRGGTLSHDGRTFGTALYWRSGMCSQAQVSGRCPSGPDDVLVQQTMARTLGVGPGDRIVLGYEDTYLQRTRNSDQSMERTRRRPRAFRVVGTYRIAHPGSAYWFDLSRFAGANDLLPPSAKGSGGSPPATPALLVAPAAMTSQTFVAGGDRPVDIGAVNLDTMGQVEKAVEGMRGGLADYSTLPALGDVDLASVFAQVRTERSLLSQVTLAAVAPLVVLALLLLFALVSAAVAARRPHIALAKLRGQSSRQVLAFALSEPFLVVGVAVPLGAALGWAGAVWVAHGWLAPGLRVVPDSVALLAVAAVALAALAAATAAAAGVVREPLASALSSSVRRVAASRWSLVLPSAVVAVAVASVAQLVSGRGRTAELLGLLTPLSLALATAVLGVLLLGMLSRWWLARTEGRGGVAAYLASRRLARRRDLTQLMIPLLLAVAVACFAASASATADEWRVSRAKAEVGAARVFTADADPGRLLAVTHRLDPQGWYLAAVVVEDSGEDASRRLLVDSSRIGAVAAWDSSWSPQSLHRLAQALSPARPAPPTLTGSRVRVTVRDVHLTSKLEGRPALWLRYADDKGVQNDVELGTLRNGAGARLRAPVARCSSGCQVEQVYLTGSASSVTDVQGRLTITGVAVDDKPVDWGLTHPGGWHPARPFPVSLIDPPVVLAPGSAGLRLRVYLGQLPPRDGQAATMLSGFAGIAPAAVPDVVPAVVTRRTRLPAPEPAQSGIGLAYPRRVVAGTTLGGAAVPLRVVGVVNALPRLGDTGVMLDLGTALGGFEPPNGAVLDVQLWAAPGTPASVLAQVRQAGVPLSAQQRLDATLAQLRTDGFSLGWRIFLLVGGATLLLAIFGVLAAAVTQSRWRSYEVAALRVVGVPRRTLVRATMLEYVVMLGFAVVLGVFSAYLSLVLVLPSVDLGAAAPHDPLPAYAVHWPILLAVGLCLFALATGVALVVARRVAALGRPSTLRWAEQA